MGNGLSSRVEERTKCTGGNSLVVQWLEHGAFTPGGLGSIVGQGTKIPRAMWGGQKIK